MQSTEQKYPPRTFLFPPLAIVCSLMLTYLTITPPLIATDWARLDVNGVYVPVRVDYPWPSYGLQVGLWVVMLVAILAISKRKKQDFHHRGTENTEKKNRDTTCRVPLILCIVFITSMGFGLRLYTLDRLPLIIDEIGFAAHASDILHGQHVPIFAPGHNANPSVYSWLMAGIMALLGQNNFAIRLLPLLFGTLSIPAIYVLGREWWSRRVGLLAAAFLAAYPAHIFFSRMSLYNIVDPFFAMLALAFLARAVRFPSLRHYWILVGLMAGIAQYFYHGSRLVLVLLALYIGLSAISGQLSAKDKPTESQRAKSKKSLAKLASWRFGIGWMIFAFGVVALPRFAPMLANSLPLTGNEQELHLPADLAANSLQALLAWVGQKDVSPFWLSDAPLLEWPALLAFAVGVLLSLWRWRDPRLGVLVASILLTTIFGGAIWTAAPLYVRYMTAAPAIALLVGVGIEKIKSVSQRSRETEKQRGKVKTRYWISFQTAAIILIAVQGIYAAVRQPEEALGRITASQWIEQELAQQAATLATGQASVLIVPEGFNEVQQITIGHYAAAYGERRVMVVSQSEKAFLDARLTQLNSLLYTVIKPH